MVASAARLLAPIAICGAAALAAGCTPVTYGTGTRTEVQTIEDITGLISLSGKDKPPIDNRPRAGIVVPPNADLPPPVDATTTASTDWPNDPDEAARKRKEAEAAAGPIDPRLDAKRDPGFRLPKGAKAPDDDAIPRNVNDHTGGSPRYDAANTAASKDAMKKMAEAKSARGGSYDENGKPVRRYLTEPPDEYREPDPNAPLDPQPPPTAKKKFSLGSLWPF